MASRVGLCSHGICALIAAMSFLALPSSGEPKPTPRAIKSAKKKMAASATSAEALNGLKKPDLQQNHLPLYFEPNQGQHDPEVLYSSRRGGQTLFLTKSEAVLVLRSKEQRQGVVRMRLAGAQAAQAVVSSERLPGRINYIIGNDRSKWRTDIPIYGRVEYRDVYPGVDLVYHGSEGSLEYDFQVAPGADPSAIEVAFEGAERVTVDRAGDLVLATSAGPVKWKRPVSYQVVGGKRRAVQSRYMLGPNGKVSFTIAGSYDRERALVIDPTLVYSTFLGGSNVDWAYGSRGGRGRKRLCHRIHPFHGFSAPKPARRRVKRFERCIRHQA
jgi:hypothetical protein